MTEFQRHMGLLDRDVAYEDVVATQFSQYWTSLQRATAHAAIGPFHAAHTLCRSAGLE